MDIDYSPCEISPFIQSAELAGMIIRLKDIYLSGDALRTAKLNEILLRLMIEISEKYCSPKAFLPQKSKKFDAVKTAISTKEHPLKLGSTITFDFWYYDKANGNCTLTLNEFLTLEEIYDKYGENIFTTNHWSCITGHIKLNRYSLSESCSDMIYNAEAVTSRLKPLGNYDAWYNAISSLLNRGITLYEGGETDVFTLVHTENLVADETVDYFTITYRSGSSYNDTKTIWFSLK